MKVDLNCLVGLGGIIAGCIGIWYGIGSRKKIDDICNRLGTKVEQISLELESDINIEKAIVDEAINRAVENKVSDEVYRASRKITDDIHKDIYRNVNDAVQSVYSNIKEKVTDRVSSEVAKITAERLSEDIREEAKEKVFEKFDENLDDILEKFNSDLRNISKIYKTISNKITGDNDKQIRISLV